jgi:hypothetical protein
VTRADETFGSDEAPCPEVDLGLVKQLEPAAVEQALKRDLTYMEIE